MRKTFNKHFTEIEYKPYFGVIYKITNNINNKIYIGQSIDFATRERLHEESGFNKNSKCYNYPLYNAIRKYGIENFSIEIIDHGNSLEELNIKEIHYIQKYNSVIDFGKGCNLDSGGNNESKSKFTKALSQRGENNPSYGKFGDKSHRAVKVINLDNLNVYGSMIRCAEVEFGNKSALKQISKVSSLNNNRISYKGHNHALIDNDNNIYIKTKVAELLGIDVENANGKSYIIVNLNKLSNRS